jgi:nucleoside-diphosphate-sugar epimerase
MRETTGYSPAWPLDKALKETVDWYMQEIRDGRVWE